MTVEIRNQAIRIIRSGRARGFTMLELLVIISILGLMAAVIGPRFIGRDAFASRGFFDEAQSVMRYAQKTAIAWRRPVYVCVTLLTTISARSGSCAGSLLVHPATGAALTTTAPAGVTLSSNPNFSFDGAGRPSAAQTITLTSTIAGDPARQIVVEAETGYVRR